MCHTVPSRKQTEPITYNQLPIMSAVLKVRAPHVARQASGLEVTAMRTIDVI